MKKFRVTPDMKNNILRCSLSKRFTREQLGKFYTEIRFAVADLKPGFDVITDYTDCTIADLDSLPTFQKIVNYLIASGVREVYRVMPPANVFCKQLSTLTERSVSYRPIVVSTIEEAEKARASLTPRAGIRFYPCGWTARYETENEQGEGVVCNISISGCRLRDISRELVPDTLCILIIEAVNEEGSDEKMTELRLQARVVRNEPGAFAVKFEELTEDTRKTLQSYLLKACETEIPLHC